MLLFILMLNQLFIFLIHYIVILKNVTLLKSCEDSSLIKLNYYKSLLSINKKLIQFSCLFYV